jgi:hypothetical protein
MCRAVTAQEDNEGGVDLVSGIKDFFDAYGRNARLYPAILVMVPLLALPSVLGSIQAISRFAVTALFGIALLYALTHVVRAFGKKAEIRLLAQWGGLPTTRWLLWSDPTLDVITKQRYHNFLREKDLPMPSAHDERADPDGARQRLASAVIWLRNNRRGDLYRILHGENASYGFRRNLYGAKSLGIILSVISACVSAGFAAVALSQSPAPTFLDSLIAIPSEVRTGFVVSLAWFCGWLFVTPAWVRESAELYAKALLETCDAPSI